MELTTMSDSHFGVVFLSPERMICELLAGHIRSAAPDISVRKAESLSELDPSALLPGTVLAFIDVGFSIRDLFENIRQASELLPNHPLALISDYRDRQLVSRGLGLGIRGFISTSMSLDALLPNLRIVLAGGEIIPPTLMLKVSADLGHFDGISVPLVPFQKPLTERERDVLCLIGKGRSNKVIAAQLELDEAAVKNYVRNLMRKTGTRNRVELALISGRQP